MVWKELRKHNRSCNLAWRVGASSGRSWYVYPTDCPWIIPSVYSRTQALYRHSCNLLVPFRTSVVGFSRFLCGTRVLFLVAGIVLACAEGWCFCVTKPAKCVQTDKAGGRSGRTEWFWINEQSLQEIRVYNIEYVIVCSRQGRCRQIRLVCYMLGEVEPPS